MRDESDWIYEGLDLAALGYEGDHGWLNASLENVLNRISRGMTKVSLPPGTRRVIPKSSNWQARGLDFLLKILDRPCSAHGSRGSSQATK